MFYPWEDLSLLAAALIVWLACGKSNISRMVFMLFIIQIAVIWGMELTAGFYTEVVLIVLSGVCGTAAVLSFIFGRLTVIPSVLALQSVFHFVGIYNIEFFDSNYWSCILSTDALLLLLCLIDRYGHNLVVSGCRALGLPLRS